MADLLGSKKEVYKSSISNTQNIALLQATGGPGIPESEGGGDITIIGGTALVPEISPSGEIKEVRPTNDQISLYVVREGDNLSQVAQMFNVSVDTIRWSNDIKGNVISMGQTLVILPVSGVRHTVKSGDTLGGIAKKYAGEASEIASYNNLSQSEALNIGDVVIIPDGESKIEIVSSRSIASANTKTVSSSYFIRPLVGGHKTQGIHGYNGVDIGAPVGTPIVASASGSVIVSRGSGWNGGYGDYVVLGHSNGTQTLYAHASEVIVFQGEKVVQGQIIGYVGSTGKSTGPHLHFEVRGARNPF